MQPISLTVNNITNDFTQFTFEDAPDFKWSPHTNTIFHPLIIDVPGVWSLLHEIAHATLSHTTYVSDASLVRAEVQAWEAAKKLAQHYGLVIDTDYIEDHLDTYREWLHKRSICPSCGQNGLQTKNTYSCINCRCVWRANEARICALRRTRLQGQGQIF